MASNSEDNENVEPSFASSETDPEESKISTVASSFDEGTGMEEEHLLEVEKFNEDLAGPKDQSSDTEADTSLKNESQVSDTANISNNDEQHQLPEADDNRVENEEDDSSWAGSNSEHKYRLPGWFLTHNVKTAEELLESEAKINVTTTATQDSELLKQSDRFGIDKQRFQDYELPHQEYLELQDITHGALFSDILSPQYHSSQQPSILLQVPRYMNIDFLGCILEQLARGTGADLVSIDSDDLVDLAIEFSHQEGKLYTEGETSDDSIRNLFSLLLEKPEVRDSDDWRGDWSKRATSTIIDAPECKSKSGGLSRDPSLAYTVNGSRPLFVHIRDAERFMTFEQGNKALDRFRERVQDYRRMNKPAILFISMFSNKVTSDDQNSTVMKLYRKIAVGPDAIVSIAYGLSFIVDETHHTQQRNIRKLKRSLRSKLRDGFRYDLLAPHTAWHAVKFERISASLRDSSWSENVVERIVRRIIGRIRGKPALELDDITKVIETPDHFNVVESQSDWMDLTKKIKESCNDLEEEVLTSCVVHPEKLQVGFENVIIDQEMKDIVKHLISLSNFSLEGVSNGLLQHIRISGLLLYGPPGTGKTHLARAIAKESNANMISVSAAEVESKFVGDTEKQIKAIFSLAVKLAPSIIFIDEADALFRKRSSNDRSWERSASNQFLQEMDGLVTIENSPFIVIATNRPMDLDEAFLRRLPQKLFLDLPAEEHRGQILKTFLREDNLSPRVSIEGLARATKGFSGSDLRTLCGQASLAFSIEQHGIQQKENRTTTSPHLILDNRHFYKAFQRTKASVSKNMMKELEEFSKRFNPPMTSLLDLGDSTQAPSAFNKTGPVAPLAMEGYPSYYREYLEEYIRIAREAIRTTSKDHPDSAKCLDNLGRLLANRYTKTKVTNDLEEVIQIYEEVVDIISKDYPDLTAMLSHLADGLGERYSRTEAIGDLIDLEKAIQIGREVINTTPHNHPDHIVMLNNLGCRLDSRYLRTDNINDLEEAVKIGREVVNITPKDHPDRAAMLRNLGSRLSDRYLRMRAMSDLEEAIKTGRDAVNITPKNHSDYTVILNDVGKALDYKYTRMGAIEVTQEALDLTPQGHRDRPERLSNLGLCLSEKYFLTSRKADLDRAIEVTQEALDLTPQGHSDRPKWLSNLGSHLFEKYSLTSRKADLDRAIEVTQEALDLTPQGHSDRPKWLSNLGGHLSKKYSLTSRKADLDRAIEVTQEAVDLTPQGHSNRPGRLNNLGGHLTKKYSLTNEKADLDRAIEVTQEAVDLTPQDHSNRPGQLSNLGLYLSKRYSLTSKKADLDRAIEVTQEALDLTPQGHSNRPKYLSNLGSHLSEKYSLTSRKADLDRAIEVTQEALDLTPQGHSNRPGRLNDLGFYLSKKYSLISKKADLDKAIEVTQEALDLTPQGHSDRPGRLSNLGLCLSEKYFLTSRKADLDRAIEVTQEALDLTPQGHSNRPERLSNLGGCLSKTYSLTNEKADLDRAIEIIQEAVDLTPQDHSDRPGRLSNLGLCLSEKYFLTSRKADLDRAIEFTQEAVYLTPQGHSDRPGRLSNLGLCFFEKYSLTNEKADLDRAIEVTQEAVDFTPQGHSNRPKWLSNLGTHLSEKYSLTSRKADLDRAIEITQEAVDLIPQDHSDRPGQLNNLGNRFFKKYCLTMDKADLDRAIRAYTEASKSPLLIVANRLQAYQFLLRLFMISMEWEKALEAGSDAIELLPALAPRSLPNSDKQRVLMSIVGLASDAAAVAVHLGKVIEAVQFLEQGRGVLIGNLTDIRSVPQELQLQHPDLADRFILLRNRLNFSTSRDQSSLPDHQTSSIQQGEARRQANQEFDRLLQEIRQQAGFRDFLKPPSRKEIQKAALEGPVIYINVSRYRSDALIIKNDSIQSLHLPRLDIDYLIDQRAKLYMSKFLDQTLLQELWDRVTFPVLKALELQKNQVKVFRQRVWWIPTGVLSRFPIQAAGYHLEEPPRSVLDTVVSSFASSLRSISRSRSNPAKSSSKPDRLVLVAMETTLGLTPLPFARNEAEEVKKICKSANLEVIEQHHKKLVLDALASCKIFHFAGHGCSDPIDPLQTCLLLGDREEDRLTLDNFIGTSALEQPPFLAYLSACNTSQVENELMIDEGLHLVNAFQLAGFQHVIGTLWDVDDKLCSDVAKIVYEHILGDEITRESVCLGLHKAIKWCRDQWRGGVLRETGESTYAADPAIASGRDYGPKIARHTRGFEWVPYIHFGG